MTGFEIAGVALAVIPIAMASYGNVAQFFDDCRSAKAQVKKFKLMIRIQVYQFRKSVKVLLSGSVDETILSVMLEDANHPGWADDAFKTSLSVVFGDDLEASDAFKTQLELIQELLGRIMDEFEVITQLKI